MSESGTILLTADDFIRSSTEKKEKLEKRMREAETKREENKKKKKAKLEKKAKDDFIKDQKTKHMVCNCRSACGTNKKCLCVKAKRGCTEYCSCHQCCSNPDNTNNNTTKASSSGDVLCCVKKCGKTLKGTLNVVCEVCGNRCHEQSCSMPYHKIINGKDVSGVVCNDCGEKED